MLTDERRAPALRLTQEVLTPMKSAFVGKDEVIDVLGVCLAAGENLFIHGPPGTAKSALVQELGRRVSGNVFDYLLTRFTEPNELFGPFDIRRLREGELVTNTDGMLPEAEFVFLDELLNANSSILNSLLMVLNERVFRRGRETRRLPLLMVVGASNRLPDDDALTALFDRFQMRVHCANVADEQLGSVLEAGWQLELQRNGREAILSADDIRHIQASTIGVDVVAVRPQYLELVRRLRRAGITVSDRRAVRVQRLVAASAVLCGRAQANATDLWVLRYIWDAMEQREVISAIVQQPVDAALESHGAAHPRARVDDAPDAESLARDFDRLEETLSEPNVTASLRATLRDQLGLLSGRCQWVVDAQQREHLEQRAAALWERLGAAP